MKVVVENTVMLNAGDAAILLAIFRILKSSLGDDLQFAVFDKDPEAARRYYPGIEFHPLTTMILERDPAPVPLLNRRWNNRYKRNVARAKRWFWSRALRSPERGIDLPVPFTAQLRKNLRIYRDADLVVSTGGTYLVEHYNVDGCFQEFFKDIALGKPLVLFTQSLGPFAKRENVERMRQVCSQAALVLLRDEQSSDNLKDIGVDPSHTAVVADSVFAFADHEALQAPFPGQRGPRPRVAVSVRQWRHFEGIEPEAGMQRYRQSVANAVTALVRDKGCDVVFLSTCQGIEEYRYDDSKVGREVFDMLDAQTQRSVSVDEAFHTPQALMDKLRSFDFVISTRMHMAIMALCVGVPVLPIAYEFKMLELFKNLRQERWVVDISTIDPDTYADIALHFSAQTQVFYEEAMPGLLVQARSALSAGSLVAAALEQRAAEPVKEVAA